MSSHEGFDSEYWIDGVGPDLPVTAVFQGGGIRGLAFIGHTMGLVGKLGRTITAYSGASGGALIATAIWAGLSPDKLRQILCDRSRGGLGLIPAMFSLGDIIQWGLSWSLVVLVSIVNLVISAVFFIPNTVRFFLRRVLRKPLLLASLKTPAFSVPYPGCRGRKFEELISDFILAGLTERGIHRELLRDVFGNQYNLRRLTFRDISNLVGFIRSVSEIDDLNSPEAQKLYEKFPKFREKITRNNFKILETDPFVRNNIFDTIYLMRTAKNPYFPPIFFSVSDIDRHKPLLINNIEERYLDIPISRIVRASAGHPFVFRPKNIKVDGVMRRCTDGGLMMNFPASSMIRALRDISVRISAQSRIDKDFYQFKTRPFVTVGLATRDIGSQTYLGSLLSLAMGEAKSLLEHELAALFPYVRVVVHELTGEPHYLSFWNVRPTYLDDLTARASSFIGGLTISNKARFSVSERTHISNQMRRSIEKFESGFGRPIEFARAHLFFFDSQDDLKMKKVAMVCHKCVIHEQTDRDISFDRAGGLIGLAADTRKTVYCRIDKLQEARSSKEGRILNLNAKDTESIRRDLNFCLAVPIYDFFSIRYKHGLMTMVDPGAELLTYIRLVDSGVDGKVLGIMTVDGRFCGQEPEWADIEKTLSSTDVIEFVERRALEIASASSIALKNSVEGFENAS